MSQENTQGIALNLNGAKSADASPLKRFNQILTNPKMQEYLLQVLGEKRSSFVNNITALVANDVKLQACSPISLIYACIKATALDLPLDSNLGFAYVIPFRNRKTSTVEAQFQLGYRGFIQLAMRSGQFRTINARDVKDGEITGEDFISGEMRFSKLPDKERVTAKTIGYVAYFRLINGFEKMSYMSVPEIDAHAKRYSQTYSNNEDYIRNASKWVTDFDAMALKTVLKLLLSKYAPLSVEMQKALVDDQAVVSENGTDTYADGVDEQIYSGNERKKNLRAIRKSEDAPAPEMP